MQSSTEKELSRIEPQAKKVYRGTKQVSHVPDVAPMENNKPEAIIELRFVKKVEFLRQIRLNMLMIQVSMQAKFEKLQQ